jgi:hypothetical protein
MDHDDEGGLSDVQSDINETTVVDEQTETSSVLSDKMQESHVRLMGLLRFMFTNSYCPTAESQPQDPNNEFLSSFFRRHAFSY